MEMEGISQGFGSLRYTVTLSWPGEGVVKPGKITPHSVRILFLKVRRVDEVTDGGGDPGSVGC